MNYNKMIVIFFGLFFFSLNASECAKAYKSVSSEAKQYSRIKSHIEAYSSSCNIVYAYSIFLHNSIEMEELENDNTYAEHLGEFVKNYPYTSKFIISRKTFKLFNKYYSPNKKAINTSIRQFFSKRELTNTKNLIYIVFSLDVLGDDFDSNKLTKFIKHLKRKYTIEEMKVVMQFWGAFKTIMLPINQTT